MRSRPIKSALLRAVPWGREGMSTTALLVLLFAGCSNTPVTPPSPYGTDRVVWMFEQRARGAIISTPLVAEHHVYAGAIQDAGLATHGAVYCLDRRTGKQVWCFDDAGTMQHMYSTPCLADGRLYIGEGMHANFVCKLYCLDAATGEKVWDFETAGHIESSPCVSEGKVYFGAGDDGLYCLDAATGAKRWHYRPPLHIDASPVVAGGRLYAGSGLSRRYRDARVFCLDADSGAVVWELPAPLPAWGSPALDGGQVFFGLGNGRLMQSVEPPERPAGAVLCVDAATGRRHWQHDVSDGVLVRPAVDARRVYFGARDGHCHAVDRRDGRLSWKTDLGSPIVTAPALRDGRLWVVASGGRVCRLAADSGAAAWTFEVETHTQMQPRLYSAPVVAAEGTDYRVYFGAELKGPGGSTALLYCLRD